MPSFSLFPSVEYLSAYPGANCSFKMSMNIPREGFFRLAPPTPGPERDLMFTPDGIMYVSASWRQQKIFNRPTPWIVARVSKSDKHPGHRDCIADFPPSRRAEAPLRRDSGQIGGLRERRLRVGRLRNRSSLLRQPRYDAGQQIGHCGDLPTQFRPIRIVQVESVF